MNSKYKHSTVIVIWAIGLIALSLYVPYGEYRYNESGHLLIKEVSNYGWFFSPPGDPTNVLLLINYKLLLLTIFVWSAVTLGAARFLKSTPS